MVPGMELELVLCKIYTLTLILSLASDCFPFTSFFCTKYLIVFNSLEFTESVTDLLFYQIPSSEYHRSDSENVHMGSI